MNRIRNPLLAVTIGALCGIAQAAAPDERTGEQVVQMRCVSCHGTGVNGAPRIGDRAAWVPRMKLGLDNVVRSAIKGHGMMPPRGGMAELTDPEIRAAVTYMFNSGVELPAAAKAAPAARDDPHRKVVAGVQLDLGVVSAQSIRARHPKGAESTMHGGIPSGDDYYHVNISLLDKRTNAPIRDAKVEARVASAMGSELKALEPMAVGGAVSYGNYFRLPGRNPHVITVIVSRPGGQPLEARFDFRRD